MSIANLRRKKNSIADLIAAGSVEKQGGYDKDEREWKPSVDEMGNGYAVVRFLPAPEGNETPWVRYWDHGFKGPTGLWFIEKSLTSIGQTCPVSESNSKLWNSGSEADKDEVRKRKRRLHYVSNVLVVKDPANPQNDGKVMLYTYGKKIHDKIMDAMQPQFEDEKPMNPFDLWEGANFRIKMQQVDGYRSYEKSSFDGVTELYDGDEDRLEDLYKQCHDLSEYVDPKNYKSYNDMASRLAVVLGEKAQDSKPLPDSSEEAREPRSQESGNVGSISAEPTIMSEDDGEDSLAYFSSLANDD